MIVLLGKDALTGPVVPSAVPWGTSGSSVAGEKASLTMYPSANEAGTQTVREGVPASIRQVGAMVNGMASICELSINVVIGNKPKMLFGYRAA